MITYQNENKEVTRKADIRATLWKRGALSYKLHSAQRIIDTAFEASPSTLFVGNCSRQWGKSYWAVTKCVAFAASHPKAQIRYGSPFQEDLLKFIIPAFDKILEDAPSTYKGRYLKAGNRYVFPNGSVIYLVGVDKNPDGLRGNTLDLVVLDEVGFMSNLDYIYKSILVPATMHRPNARIIMISTPPSTPAHEFADYVQKAQIEGGYAEFDIYQNPRIDQATISRLIKESGGEDSTTWQREYLCKFVTDSNLQIIPEWRDDFVHDLKRDEFFGYYHRYVAMDLGRIDKTAIIFGHYDFKKAALVLEDEVEMVGAAWTTQTLVKELKEKELELWGEGRPYRRISDNNNPHLIIDLASLHNINFIETTKESLEAMVNELRLLVAQGRILVNPRCKMLIGCLKYGVWDEKRKEFARSKTYGHFDMLAALIYLIRNLDKSTNPIPATHGFEPHRSYLGHVEGRLSGNAKTLQDVFKLTRK